jgi:hypothetical protein
MNMAKKKNAKQKKVDYLYGDLSKVETEALKAALQAYKMLLTNKRQSRYHERALNVIHRIEGELLARKELIFRRC